MSAELGAQAGLVAPDDVTTRRLAARGGARGRPGDLAQRRGRARRRHDVQHDFDAAVAGAQVALPHSPANVRAVDDHADTRIDVAYIGACTGAKLDDLRFAAQVLAGAGSPPACSCWSRRPA
jgi:3-isopropylmalate/(R)-2-methylmalate dehydratase large subunit